MYYNFIFITSIQNMFLTYIHVEIKTMVVDSLKKEVIFVMQYTS